MGSLPNEEDLGTWLGVTIDNEERALAIIAAAYTLVRSKTGQAWVDASGQQLETVSDDDFEIIRTVIIQVAARVWINPHGNTQETKGPFSRSMAEWASLGLSLTEAELGMLPVTTGRRALWTQSTTREHIEGLSDIYLEVVGSEDIPHVPQGSVNW